MPSETQPFLAGFDSNDRGQIIVLLAICLTVLLMFLALSIDVGFAYVTQAKLSRAVDAACLEAMKNLSQGQAMARTLAQNTFNANYRRPVWMPMLRC